MHDNAFGGVGEVQRCPGILDGAYIDGTAYLYLIGSTWNIHEAIPDAGEMVQMMAMWELPLREGWRMRVSLDSR